MTTSHMRYNYLIIIYFNSMTFFFLVFFYLQVTTPLFLQPWSYHWLLASLVQIFFWPHYPPSIWNGFSILQISNVAVYLVHGFLLLPLYTSPPFPLMYSPLLSVTLECLPNNHTRILIKFCYWALQALIIKLNLFDILLGP